MRLLSLDTSLASTGYAVFEVNDGIYNLVTYGKIVTEKQEFVTNDIYNEDDRLNYICNIIENLIEEYNITHICAENQFVGGNRASGLVLKKLIGGVMRTAYYKKLKIKYYLPSQWRKILKINKGKDKKLEAYNYLISQNINIGEFKPKGKNKNDDLIDDICIGLAYINEVKYEK